MRVETIASVVVDAVLLYAAIGVLVALAFAAGGILRLLPPGRPATIGARLILLPGAVALWPLVLRRWRDAGRGP